MPGLPCMENIGSTVLSEAELQLVNSLCTPSTAISWQSLWGAAIFASLAILVFLYLFAVLFRNEKIFVWIKMEMYELGSTIVIVFALAGMIQILCNFNAGWIFSDAQLSAMNVDGLNSQSSMYTMAATYLHSIGDNVLMWMCWDMIGSIFADLGTATQFMVRPMGQGFHTVPFGGFFSPLKLILNNAMIGMVIAYVVNEAFLNILKYCIVAFPKFFLPFGIVFRSFEPTRRFGGTLIALSISFLVIYPILLSLSFYVNEVGILSWHSINEVYAAKFNNIGGSVSEAMSDIFNGFINTIQEQGAGSIVGALFGSFFIIIELLVTVVLTVFGSLFGLIFFFFGGVAVWKLAFVGFILPALSAIMLVYGMRSLGRVLGEPIDITSLTRVI